MSLKLFIFHFIENHFLQHKRQPPSSYVFRHRQVHCASLSELSDILFSCPDMDNLRWDRRVFRRYEFWKCDDWDWVHLDNFAGRLDTRKRSAVLICCDKILREDLKKKMSMSFSLFSFSISKNTHLVLASWQNFSNILLANIWMWNYDSSSPCVCWSSCSKTIRYRAHRTCS